MNAAVKALYKRADEVNHRDRSKIFGRPLEEKLKDSVKQLQKWVAHITPAVKEAIHDYNKRLKQQTHDIRDFFTVKSKKKQATNTIDTPKETDNSENTALAAEEVETIPRNPLQNDEAEQQTEGLRQDQQQQQQQQQKHGNKGSSRKQTKANKRHRATTHRPSSMSNTTSNTDAPT